MRACLAIIAIIAIWFKLCESTTDFNISRITESIVGKEGDFAEVVTDVFLSTFKTFLNSSFKLENFNLTTFPANENKYPDVDRNCSEIIKSRGFIAEEHKVVTTGGWILTLIRIVNPFRQQKGRPVFLQHGLFGNAEQFLNDAIGRINKSGVYMEDDDTLINDCLTEASVARTMGFVLSHCGYDVWLGNTRGNKYSTAHTTLNPETDLKYWDFSTDHLTYYDLVASIQYVLHKTNHKTLGYIGHSLGTTMMFQLLATQPHYSNIIKPFIALAPVAYISRAKAPAVRLIAFAEALVPNLCDSSIPMFKWSPNLIANIAKNICGNKATVQLCTTVLFAFVGTDFKNLDISRIPAFMSPFPDATSSWVLCQLARRVNRKSFAHFDYGYQRNKEIYGNPEPPRYELSSINSTDMHLMSGVNDFLADPADVAQLRSQLKVQHRSIVMRDPDFNHADFIFGKTTGVVNKRCLNILKKYDQNLG